MAGRAAKTRRKGKAFQNEVGVLQERAEGRKGLD